MEIQKPCSYELVVVEHGTSTPIKYEKCRGPDAMKKLIKSLESLARDTCWICEEQFAEESMMVVDHCHLLTSF